MGRYIGKISGIGNALTRTNEITADDLGVIRNYIIGWESGVIDVITSIININELPLVKTKINENGELIIVYPDDYQGTTFYRVENNLYAIINEELEEIKFIKVEGNLILEE